MLTSKCSTICLAYFPTCPAYLSTSGVLAAMSPHRGISGAIYTSEQETPLRKKRFQHTRAGLNLLLKTPHMILRYPEECKARKGRTIIIWCLSSWGLAPVAWARAYAIKLYLVFFSKKMTLGDDHGSHPSSWSIWATWAMWKALGCINTY